MNTGIYSVTNGVNGKRYIGSAVNLKRRKYEHFHYLRKGSHHNIHLQRAFNKYGEDSFYFEVLEICDKEVLLTKESENIKKYKSNEKDYGYNTEDCLATMLGKRHTEETKNKLREARKKQVIPKESYEKGVKTRLKNNPNYFSDIAKKGWEINRAKGITKIPVSPDIYRTQEFRDKMSKITKERAYKNAKPFICVETQEIFLLTTDAAKKLGIKSYKCICRVLKGERKHTNGYHFEYINENSVKETS